MYVFNQPKLTVENARLCANKLTGMLAGDGKPDLIYQNSGKRKWAKIRVVFAKRGGVCLAPVILLQYCGTSPHSTQRWAIISPWEKWGKGEAFHFLENIKPADCKVGSLKEYADKPEKLLKDFDRVEVYGPRAYLNLALTLRSYGPWSAFPGPKGLPKKSLTSAS